MEMSKGCSQYLYSVLNKESQVFPARSQKTMLVVNSKSTSLMD